MHVKLAKVSSSLLSVSFSTGNDQSRTLRNNRDGNDRIQGKRLRPACNLQALLRMKMGVLPSRGTGYYAKVSNIL